MNTNGRAVLPAGSTTRLNADCARGGAPGKSRHYSPNGRNLRGPCESGAHPFNTVLLMVAREVASAEVNHARQRADTRAQHAAEARARAATHKIMERQE